MFIISNAIVLCPKTLHTVYIFQHFTASKCAAGKTVWENIDTECRINLDKAGLQITSRVRRIEAKLRQDRQSTYKRNIYARSRNHCWCENATSITHSVCVCVCVWVWVCSLSYPSLNAHAPYYTVICGLSVSAILFHIITQTAIFSWGGS
jgi:hypothetical protein